MNREDSDSAMHTAEERKYEEEQKMQRLVKIITEMLNPKDNKDLIELDSIYQLKTLIRNYYIRKGKMGEELLSKLDAIMVERPNCL